MKQNLLNKMMNANEINSPDYIFEYGDNVEFISIIPGSGKQYTRNDNVNG